jgi:hypothetical protein
MPWLGPLRGSRVVVVSSSALQPEARPRTGVAGRPWFGVLIGLLLGAAVGVATSFAQADLSGNWASLANAASPWLVAPFVAGAVLANRGAAIGAGLMACLVEVAGYYVATPLRGFPVAHNEIAFWTACAVFGGPTFGWAGWAWRHGTARIRPAGAAMPAATFLGEAIGAYAIRLHFLGDAILFAVIGLLQLSAATLQSSTRRALVGWTLTLTVLGAVLYGPLLQATSRFAFGA